MERRKICNLYEKWKKEGKINLISANKEMDAFVAGFIICEETYKEIMNNIVDRHTRPLPQ